MLRIHSKISLSGAERQLKVFLQVSVCLTELARVLLQVAERGAW